ncbi:uncharacterized protein LOC119674241 [Teleopsis dalmanni]|uniref:uncharacterized protein LOC119674241 n=1 Tax=Teleopsis dalmanni TaxID=139649 RepID=UPI0018CF54A4|nr:uncharacterized protein LOC119674241 [Teleopsis dalmanni]
MEIKTLSPFITNVTYWIDNGTVNAEMQITHTLNYGLRNYIDLQIRLADSKKYQSLFSYDIDLCKLLNEFFRESLLKTWYRNLLKYSNLMENCPIMEGFYYIRKYKMAPGTLPPYLRPGDYRLSALSFFGRRNTKKFRPFSDFITYLTIF